MQQQRAVKADSLVGVLDRLDVDKMYKNCEKYTELFH